MASPVRYPSGVTNVKSTDACRNLPFPSRTRIHYQFDDFDWFQPGQASEEGRWASVTEGSDDVIALTDGDGGQLQLHCGTVSDVELLIYNVKENFTLEAGKKAWFGIRMKTSTEVTEVNWRAGLAQTDTSPIAGAPSNYAWFRTDEADTNVDIDVGSAGSSQASATGIDTLVAGTFATYEFEFDGVDTFKYWIDGAEAGSITTTSFPTTEMGMVIAIENSSAGSLATRPSIEVDWVYAAKERTTTND